MDLSSMLNEPSDPRDDYQRDTNVMYTFSTAMHYFVGKDAKSKSPINGGGGAPTKTTRPLDDANRTTSGPQNKKPKISQNNDSLPSSSSSSSSAQASSSAPLPIVAAAAAATPAIPATPAVSSMVNTNCLKLTPTCGIISDPSLWKPKLSLDYVMKEHPLSYKPVRRNHVNNSFDAPVELKLHETVIRGGEPTLLLEDNYEIQGSHPRGFFVMMAKRSITHNFVFQFPDHPWFEDLFGLRKSAYIHLRTEDGELWELHLKPSRDKLYLFGYFIKQSDMLRIVKDSMEELIHYRRLPLVLDLDDTLVRLVGTGDRYVPESELHKYGNRVHALRDKKRVVVTERVHEFLDWAQQFYDISVCSLGDQNYVENVVDVLDPQRTRIRGILYSARSEHDYIKRSPDPGRPPKDLLALYSFCGIKDKSLGSAFSLPLILDDETRMWPSEQHDNIIEVIHQANTPVWSVSLFPAVQDCLQFVHAEFFRQYDLWYNKQQEAEQMGTICTRQPPSAVAIYKTYLRHILRDMIAKGPAL